MSWLTCRQFTGYRYKAVKDTHCNVDNGWTIVPRMFCLTAAAIRDCSCDWLEKPWILTHEYCQHQWHTMKNINWTINQWEKTSNIAHMSAFEDNLQPRHMLGYQAKTRWFARALGRLKLRQMLCSGDPWSYATLGCKTMLTNTWDKFTLNALSAWQIRVAKWYRYGVCPLKLLLVPGTTPSQCLTCLKFLATRSCQVNDLYWPNHEHVLGYC